MVRATLYFQVKEGRGDEFEQAWVAIADAVREIPGSIRQTLLRDPNDPAAYVLTSDWQTREQFHAFERSPEQDDLTAPLRDLRESARMAVYDVIQHVEGA